MKGGNSAVASWAVRIALAAAFLSAVADRLGLWGPPGTDGVGWGSVEHYEAYLAKLLPFLKPDAVPATGWAVTAAEVALAVGLLVGWQLRWVALGSALLLASFAVAMASVIGPKAPLDYSVFSAAAGAFLLFATQGK